MDFKLTKFEPSEYAAPSVVILILMNLAPLYGVIFLGWEIFPLLFLYWFENVIVGGFNVLKMLIAHPKDVFGWLGKLFIIPFFCFHYGLFTEGHGWFIYKLFSDVTVKGVDFPTVSIILQTIKRFDLFYIVLCLIATHTFSFFFNYVRNGEYNTVTSFQLMAQPYLRIVILHVTILVGGLLAQELHSPMLALVLLILLKIGVDVFVHLFERRKVGETTKTSIETE